MESVSHAPYKEFLIILGAAGLIVPLLVRLGINSILGFLLVGFLLSPDVLGSLAGTFPLLNALVFSHGQGIISLCELGVVFLLFLIGLALSPDRLLSMSRLVSVLVGLQVVVTSFSSALTVF